MDRGGARIHRLRWGLLVFLVAVGVYAPVLRAGFVWDDRQIFSTMPSELSSLRDFFSPTRDESRIRYTGHHFYPLTELTLRLDQELNLALFNSSVPLLDRRRALVPHATTLLLHGLAAVLVGLLVWELLWRLPHRDEGALAAGLLFALHPIHAESVCFIIGRTDVLAAVFMLASILAALRYQGEGRRGAALVSALLFGLALLSKELAVTELLLLPLVLRAWGRRAQRVPAWPLMASFAAVFVAYLAVRMRPGGPLSLALSVSLRDLPMRILGALAFYVEKAVLPVHATPFAVACPGPLATAVVLALSAGFALGAVLLRRRGDPVPLLGVAVFFVCLAPALLVAISPEFSLTPLAERYLYVPSIGLSIVVGDLVAYLLASLRWRPAAWAAIALVLAIAAAASATRTRIWDSDLGLWQYVIRDPDAAQQAAPWYNLGFAYEDADRPQKAREAFRRARGGAGTASFHAGALRQVAEAEFDEAIGAFRLGHFRAAEARAQEARATLSDAKSLDPTSTSTALAAARYGYLQADAHRRATGQVDRALLEEVVDRLRGELAVDPGNAEARRLLVSARRALAEAPASGEPEETAPGEGVPHP